MGLVDDHGAGTRQDLAESRPFQRQVGEQQVVVDDDDVGGGALVAVAVIVDEGTIFTAETIEKVDQITARLDGEGYDSQTEKRSARREELSQQGLDPFEIMRRLDREYPPYPVNHDRVESFTHNSTRVVTILPDGSITSDVLVDDVPESQEEANEIRDLVQQNPPYIFGRLVSRDQKGALITANFVSERLSSREVYQAVFDHVQHIKYGWRCGEHEISVGMECTQGEWIWEPMDDRVRFEEGLIDDESQIKHRVYISGSPIARAI